MNAVLPVLISDFQVVRSQAADSVLRKIKEYRPDFDLKERDGPKFVSFVFRSTRGLRHAGIVTRFVACFSIGACAISLAALTWAAIDPYREISIVHMLAYVGVTLVMAPVIYVAKNAYLKWLYSLLVTHSSDEESETLLFAHCVDLYLTHERRWAPIAEDLNSPVSQIPLMIWRLRWARIQIRMMRLRRAIAAAFRSNRSAR